MNVGVHGSGSQWSCGCSGLCLGYNGGLHSCLLVRGKDKEDGCEDDEECGGECSCKETPEDAEYEQEWIIVDSDKVVGEDVESQGGGFAYPAAQECGDYGYVDGDFAMS